MKKNSYAPDFEGIHAYLDALQTPKNLRENSNSRYEYILPNVFFGKTFFTEKYGVLDFNSNAIYNNYETNKHKTFLTNDIIWKPSSRVTKSGFINSLEGMLRNFNYKSKFLTGKKGDVVIFDSSLWHKGGMPSNLPRLGIFNLYGPWWIKPYFNFQKMIGKKGTKLNKFVRKNSLHH